MALILRLLIRAAPLLALFLLSRVARDVFRAARESGGFNQWPPPGGHWGGPPPTGGPGGKKAKDPFDVLGCSPSCSNDEVKKRYRELLNKYHPDKFIGQDLDADFVELASKKFQEIQEAYEAIRSRRGF